MLGPNRTVLAGGTARMGNILEFPLWLAQRSPPSAEVSTAQIVIFPGVRRETCGAAAERLLPVPRGAAGPLRED